MKHKTIAVVLLILAPSILLRALAMDILLPSIPAIAQYFAIPFATSQWVLSIFFFGAGIGQLLWGPLADERGRRKVLLLASVVLICTSIACAYATNIYSLIIFRFIQGLAAGGTTDITMAIVRDLYDDRTTPKVYSYFNSIIGLAPLLAPLIGGLLLTHTNSWQASFYFVAGFCFLAFIINYIAVPETNPRLSVKKTFISLRIWHDYKKILSDKKFLSYTFCAVMAFSCLFMFFSTSAILMIEIVGLSPTIYGYYFALNSVVYIIGNALSPTLQNRVGANTTILHGSAIIVIGAACMLLAHLSHGLTVLGLMLPNIIVTFGVGLIFGPCMAGVMKEYRHIAAMASAVYGAILYSSSSLLVTAIMQFKISDTRLLAVTLALMGIANVWVIRKLIRQQLAA